MKYFFIIVIAIGILEIIPVDRIDPRTKAYYDTFVEKMEDYSCDGLPWETRIEIKPITRMVGNKEVIGHCDRRYGRAYITINETYWNNASSEDRFEVLTHEMSHCILGDHGHNDTNPNSLINPEYASASFEQTNRQIKRELNHICRKL